MNKESQQVRRMFASIAHRYDRLNHLLSFSIDRYWRRVTVWKLAPFLPEEALILDLCTGTGDLALALSSKAQVVGCDFCHPMLVFGQEKVQSCQLAGRIQFVEGDALQLPFPACHFDAVVVAFGLRNLENYNEGLSEMFRVLRPGGTLVVTEFSQPRIPIFKQVYFVYFVHILPRVGALLSGEKGPYSYLPQSVKDFPDPARLQQMIEQVGFTAARQHSLTGGIVVLYLAQKPVVGITGLAR